MLLLLTSCPLRLTVLERRQKCLEETEPDLPAGADGEWEGEWAAEAVPAPAGELEGRAEQGRAQDREGNAFARNAGRPFRTRPAHPAFR